MTASLMMAQKDAKRNTVSDGCQYVLISTDYGDMKVKLYQETPRHTANFVKLVKEGFFDGLLFQF